MLGLHSCISRGATLIAYASLLVVFCFFLPKSALAVTQAQLTFIGTSTVSSVTGAPISIYTHYGGRALPVNSSQCFDLDGTITAPCSPLSNVGTIQLFDFQSFVNYVAHSSRPNGDYFYLWGGSSFYTFEYYVKITKGTEGITSTIDYNLGFNSETQTRFTDIQITGTSTVNIDATYWLEQSEIESNISEFNPTLISFEYSLRPDTDFTVRSEQISNLILDGSQSTDTNLPSLSDGTYDLLVRFSNFGVPFGASRPFPKSYVYTSFTITGGVLAATGTPEFYDYSIEYPTDRYGECSVTQIAGCIQNAFIFLLYPPEPSLQIYYDTLELIPSKFPFAYFYAVQDSVLALSDIASSTSPVNFSLDLTATPLFPEEIPILSTTTVDSFLGSSARELFRDITGYVIWITFAFMVFFKVRKLFG